MCTSPSHIIHDGRALPGSTPEFFNVLNFALQFCPIYFSETKLMDRFAQIGVGAGLTFDPSKLEPETEATLEDGWADVRANFANSLFLLEEPLDIEE